MLPSPLWPGHVPLPHISLYPLWCWAQAGLPPAPLHMAGCCLLFESQALDWNDHPVCSQTRIAQPVCQGKRLSITGLVYLCLTKGRLQGDLIIAIVPTWGTRFGNRLLIIFFWSQHRKSQPGPKFIKFRWEFGTNLNGPITIGRPYQSF